MAGGARSRQRTRLEGPHLSCRRFSTKIGAIPLVAHRACVSQIGINANDVMVFHIVGACSSQCPLITVYMGHLGWPRVRPVTLRLFAEATCVTHWTMNQNVRLGAHCVG